MDKIIILTDDSEKYQNLKEYLEFVFPDCQLQIETGGTAAGRIRPMINNIAPGLSKKIAHGSSASTGDLWRQPALSR